MVSTATAQLVALLEVMLADRPPNYAAILESLSIVTEGIMVSIDACFLSVAAFPDFICNAFAGTAGERIVVA